MRKPFPKVPYKIGAPSMVFGEDLLENVRLLAGLVDHIEIILFHTPSLHNIPGSHQVRALKNIREREDVTITVHLPDALEIASPDRSRREESVQLATELCLQLEELDPMYYVLHIPFTPPTLVPVPGQYFHTAKGQDWDGWSNRALQSLERLHGGIGQKNKLLVENINYSPSFLLPFCREGLSSLCLDIGHLMLGQEDVMGVMRQVLDVTHLIHLHGVKGYEEHLSLSILPRDLVDGLLGYLKEASYQGVIVLEVFNAGDLEESMNVLLETS